MVLAAVFVVGCLSWVAVAISSGLRAIDDTNVELRQALEAMDVYRKAGGPQAGPDVEIPKEALKLDSYLEQAANSVGIEIPEFNPRTPVERGAYVETSTRIELRELTILQLKDFLERIESDRRVVVSNLNIKRDFRDKEKLDVDMVVSTFSKPTRPGRAAEMRVAWPSELTEKQKRLLTWVGLPVLGLLTFI